jgi:hypothetical protein
VLSRTHVAFRLGQIDGVPAGTGAGDRWEGKMGQTPRLSLLGLLLVMAFAYGVWIIVTSGQAASADACLGYALCR